MANANLKAFMRLLSKVCCELPSFKLRNAFSLFFINESSAIIPSLSSSFVYRIIPTFFRYRYIAKS